MRAIQRDGNSKWLVGLYMNNVLVSVPEPSVASPEWFSGTEKLIRYCIHRNVGMRLVNNTVLIRMGSEEHQLVIAKSVN